MKKAYFNWSGGKDSSLALCHALKSNKYEIKFLFSTILANGEKVSMHQTSARLLEKQALEIGIPLKIFRFNPEWTETEYQSEIARYMDQFKTQDINVAIFGDIHLENIRARRMENCRANGIAANFPLWGKPTLELISEFIKSKFKAVITSIDATALPPEFLGMEIDGDFLRKYPKTADICGENGEYHSFVFDGPIFSKPVEYKINNKYYVDCVDPAGFTHKYAYLELESKS